MNTTSLNVYLILTFSAIFLTFASVVGATAYLVAARADDSLIINLAGRQRMLTQKYTKEMLASMRIQEEDTRFLTTGDALHDPTITRQLFEDTFNAFLTGGPTFSDLVATDPIHIQPIAEQSARDLLRDAQNKWHALTTACENGSLAFQGEGHLPEADRRHILAASVICLQQMHRAVDELNRISDTKQTLIMRVMGSGLILVLLMSLAALVFVRKRIFNPLEDTVSWVEAIADGRLQSRDEHIRKDEIGRLQTAVNMLSKNLVATLNQLHTSAVLLSNGADHFQAFHRETEQLKHMNTALAASSHELVNHNQQVADEVTHIDFDTEILKTSLSHIDRELKDLGVSTQSITTSANVLSNEVNDIASSLTDLSTGTEETQIIAKKIQTETKQSTQLMKNLGQAAYQINDIVQLIRDVAQQTNLLALNATREGTVAGEVNNLAGRVEYATVEIQNQVAAIQASTTAAVAGIDRMLILAEKLRSDCAKVNAGIADQRHNIQNVAKGLSDNHREITSATKNMDRVGNEVGLISDHLVHLTQRTHELHTVMDRSKSVADAIATKVKAGETKVAQIADIGEKAAEAGQKLVFYSERYRKNLQEFHLADVFEA